MRSKNLVNFDPWKIQTVKKTQKSFEQIYSFLFNLKIKQNSAIPFLPWFIFPASVNNICAKKWLTA
jgi:hypothetical protein